MGTVCECIICGDKRATHTLNGEIDNFVCCYCGNFNSKLPKKQDWKNEEFAEKAPAIAFERKIQGRDGYILSWDGNQVCANLLPFTSDYPVTFLEKIERVFMNLARSSEFNPLKVLRYNAYPIYDIRDLPKQAFFVATDKEVPTIIEFLNEDFKWITRIYDALTSSTEIRFKLSVAGVKKALEDIAKIGDIAFLAMWFSDKLDDYVLAVEKAVNAAGYSLVKIDQIHHNEYIMDKVLNSIRESRFIIADLTTVPEELHGDKVNGGVRGGVYYEAGYAKGLGRQVILTCQQTDEALARVHFDTQQINTIFWHKSAESQKILCNGDKKLDFIDYLKERIIATVGRGPLAKQERR